nr:MAG TPA: hypothetical protein [Caudoviricetes sp.]DAU84642.1 MAG TPA: hypothetical protein [Caudoviricetes sp.]
MPNIRVKLKFLIFIWRKYIMDKKIGVIHEIGDMGLGFEELTEKDQQALNEQSKKEQDEKSQK